MNPARYPSHSSQSSNTDPTSWYTVPNTPHPPSSWSTLPSQLNHTNRYPFSLSLLPRPRLPSISRPFEILAIHRILASSSKSKTVRSFEIHRRTGRSERKRNGKREREMGTRIRFGARFMRRTVGNNRSGNSAGIVSAGAVHSTPQTLSFEPLARSCSSSSLSLLSTPYPQCHPVVVVVVVVVLLDTRQMTISPG